MTRGVEMRRTDAKAYFANERTFLHWMSTAVTIGSIAAALSGVAGHAHRHWGDEFTERAVIVRVVALMMLVISIVIAIWAGWNFQKRALYLEAKLDGPYDSRYLPVLLTVVMVLALGVVFAGALVRVSEPATP